MAKSFPRSPFPSVLSILAETSSLCALEKVTTPATRPTLPYRVPDELLPAPLPSVAEILAASPVGSHREGEVPIYRVGEHFAVKIYPRMATRRYMGYAGSAGKATMAASGGNRYEKGVSWINGSNNDRTRTRLSRGHTRLTSSGLRPCCATSTRSRRAYRKVFNGHNGSVFTHAGLVGQNLILRKDGTVVMVNWQNAGWYPAYWEYCCSDVYGRRFDRTGSRWGWELAGMLDEYFAEADLMSRHKDYIYTL
ncbi:hypothetical protein F5144DRAFT_590462 [Chaetomium tenue]|uniref:Uncharacterized protein n=1 Tax=Chaetomium tenue TaxID=1854479 RepID=A0ACB7PGL5_9PEZI|nr:hypothetical protein F5144DRAFT_590462 [Chaetomium globosum]